MKKSIKKLLTTIVVLSMVFAFNVTNVLAASIEEDNPNIILNESVISHTSVESASVGRNASDISIMAIASTVTHYSSVSSSYGALICSLTGSAWCKTSAGAKTDASYSAVSSFLHSNGDTLTTAAKTGSSSSTTDFTWSSSDSSNGMYSTSSTTTLTTCSKSGYNTVTITNTSAR